jgi:hypothetical protein
LTKESSFASISEAKHNYFNRSHTMVMKINSRLASLIIAGATCVSLSAGAATYPDSTGENFTAAGGGILDITSVEVNNTATDLIFKINLAGDPVGTDWGKYMIGIDSTVGGDTAGNGWGRPISMPSGMDYWAGSWVDSGNGVQVHKYTGAWSQIGGAGPFAGGPAVPGLAIAKDISSVTITAPLSLLGLAPGNSFHFDVYTSGGGGGDSAVDALANPAQTINDWGVPYASQTTVLYTISEVPEPAACTLLGLASLVLIRMVRRNR